MNDEFTWLEGVELRTRCRTLAAELRQLREFYTTDSERAVTAEARVKELERAIGPELQRLVSLADYHRKKGRDQEADEIADRAERLKRVLLKPTQSSEEGSHGET